MENSTGCCGAAVADYFVIFKDVMMNISGARLILVSILLLLLIMLPGCATIPNVATEEFNNRRVEYSLIRNGGATVVFENGLDGKMNWWSKVIPEISKDATTFAYNRPGYGRSDSMSTPRDGLHIVEELRTLLKETDLSRRMCSSDTRSGGCLCSFSRAGIPAR